MTGKAVYKVIIDTDLGVDDAHAVALALQSPEIDILGFTTVFGNTDVEWCTRNVLYFLELVGKTHIPVYQGAGTSLLGEMVQKGKRVHGERGLGDFEPPEVKTAPAKGNAIEWLVNTVMDHPGEIEILALGPLTNLALAALIEPKWAAAVKRVIFMGGAIHRPGVILPLSTANTYNDPEGSKIAFRAGYPIVMVGRDVTDKALFTLETLAELHKANTPITRFLDQITPHYYEYYATLHPEMRGKGFVCHDLLVTAYLLKPELFTTSKVFVDVETKGDLTRGQTVADFRSNSTATPQMDVCWGVDSEEMYKFYLDRVTRPVE